MGSIDKRLTDTGQPRWDVRYRDPSGKQRKQSFARRSDASRFASTVEADKSRGLYVDPSAGRLTFEAYATEWLAVQTFDHSTHDAAELRLRLHVFPVLGSIQLKLIKPQTINS